MTPGEREGRASCRIRATHRVRRALLLTGVASWAVLSSGCIPSAGPGAPAPGGASPAAGDVRPAGISGAAGSLRQDEITVQLQLDRVQVRVTPLDRSILELAAPDTRRRLESLAAGTGDDRTAFLVSVFTGTPGGAEFEPRNVFLENRGRRYTPLAIRALTPGWGTPLRQDRPAQAVYLFPGEIDLELPLTVEVGGVRSRAWESILPRLDAERTRLRARGG